MSKKVAKKWIRNASDELAIKEGCYFDQSAGQKVIDFFEQFLRHSKGQFANKPFKLLPWQKDLIYRLYGFMRPDGTRRFREAYIEVPKKNGKSSLLSGLALYHFLADGEAGAEVYTAACDRSQASIIFNEAKNMVEASPALYRRLNIIPSKKQIEYKGTRSVLTALSAEVGSKEGLNISFACIDELHRQKSGDLYHTLKYGGAARSQPLLVCITTAGHDRQSICYQRREYAEQVNAGIKEDTSFFGLMYCAEADDDFTEPAVWAKANPSLGTTIKVEDFKRDCAEAQSNPAELNSWLRYRLSIWTSAEARYFERSKWDQCGTVPIDLKALEGRDCWAGLDLASTTDTASLVLVFPDEDQNFTVLPFFWIPKANAVLRERRDHVDYLVWEKQGYITLTEGERIDYDFILDRVLELNKRFVIRQLVADPKEANRLGNQILQQGIPVEWFSQNFAAMSAPTKELERLVTLGKIRHGNHPVLRWQADNTVVLIGKHEEVKIVKPRSYRKVDGIVSLVMALEAANRDLGYAAPSLTIF